MWYMYFYIKMRLYTFKLKYEFILACTIWTLREKEISFNIVLLMCENRSSYIKYLALLHFRTPPIVIDDSSWKNAAESFTVTLTLTLGGYESAIAPIILHFTHFSLTTFLIPIN